MSAPRSAGFTLVEVLVALILAGTVLAGAAAVVGQLSAEKERQERADAELDRKATFEGWLRAAMASLAPSDAPQRRFHGTPTGFSFRARLLTAAGWFEERPVSLGVSEGKLTLRFATTELQRADCVDELKVAYLGRLGERREWVTSWTAVVTVPLAVRLRFVVRPHCGPAALRDSLLVLVRERG